MKIFISGGAGDLGVLLARDLESQNDLPVRLDVRSPRNPQRGEVVKGSILDRVTLARVMQDCEMVIHIAAWHGIHLVTGRKNAYDFWDLNVTGTFNVFEQAAQYGIKKFIYISSTSIQDHYGVYGHTKVLGEEITRTYQQRHGMDVIVLRPSAFIPYWNQEAYQSFDEWARWYWKGAVHINDVLQAVMLSVKYLKQEFFSEMPVLYIDGKYEYTPVDLDRWDAAGPGTTFRKYYQDFSDIAHQYALDIASKPELFEIEPASKILGYQPTYSFLNVLQDLQEFGKEGPPLPDF